MKKEEVDREVGNDTEQFRTNCLKYINYGRQLAADDLASSGQVTKEQHEEAMAKQAKDTAALVLDEVDKIEAEVNSRAGKVEEFTEKGAFFKLKQSYAGNDAARAVLEEVEALMKSVDEAHTKILAEFKAPALQELRERYT